MASSREVLSGLDIGGIENVFVYVADSLRWDALPERVAARGVTCRTAASALLTPQSMPSLVTGLYPPRHGVEWFDHSLPADVETIFDDDGVNGSFVNTTLQRPLDALLGDPAERTLGEVEPPFVHVELDHGGHAPYPGMTDETPREIFEEYSGDTAAVRGHYEAGVEESVDRFERRLDALDRRGLLEETLVVFTSDHGELLGDRGGFVGHGLPPSPELAYVPTTFVHPSLSRHRHDDHLVRHVDLVPTVVDVLGLRSRSSLDGRSLLSEARSDRPAYVHGTVLPPQRWRGTLFDPALEAPSVWTATGGHVFVQSRLPNRILVACYEALLSGYTAAFNSDRSRLATLATAARRYVPRTWTYGEPSLEVGAAREFCRDVFEREADAEVTGLSAETRSHLEDLGYV